MSLQLINFLVIMTFEGLSKENEVCSEDTDCESNHCLNNSCVCNRDKPVLIHHKCYSGEFFLHAYFDLIVQID